MARLMIFFTHPENTETFDRRFATEFLPAANALPGVDRVTVLRVAGGPLGDAPYYLIGELTFADRDALRDAVTSQAGRALLAALRFAPGLATTIYAEEETRYG